MSTGGATLQGSFSGATGTIQASGFVWGTDDSCSEGDIQLGSQSGTSGNLSFNLTGLTAGRTYYYRAYVQVWDTATSDVVDCYGDVVAFTTLPAESGITDSGWLELPQIVGNESATGSFYGSGSQVGSNRNYSYNYSYTYYAPLWTAYPLAGSHKSGSASTNSWNYNPNISTAYQINMTGNSYPTMYNASYSKGHMCPDADRKSDNLMNQQTYYCTNQVPQIQNGFNGGIWSSLENAVRDLVSSGTDTVYVVTGPCFRKVGGSEDITMIHAASGQSGVNPTDVPIANYYWKALLKVRRNGTQIQAASAIGFWFEHRAYSGDSYTNHTVSVAQIQEWTGFDLFHNLPDGIETAAEANTSWSDFQNFSF